MRLFKLIVILVILCLIGVFAFQNYDVWNQSVNLKYNLYLVSKTLPVRVPLLALIALVLGFCLGLAVLMKFHFKTRRQLKIERMEKKQAQDLATHILAGAEPPNASASNASGAGSPKEG